MLHGTVWDTPSASSKKEVSFKPETELGYVTSNCVERAVRQFVIASRFKKWPQPSLLSLAPKIKASSPLKINLGFGLKLVQN